MSGDKDGLLYWPKFFLDHSSTSFASWLGLFIQGSLRAQSPQSTAGSHFVILSPTDSNHLGTWLFYFLTSTCFRCSSAYLHRCICRLTARSRVNIYQLSHSYFSKFHMWTFSSRPSPSPSHSHILKIILQDNNSKNIKKRIITQQQNTKILIRKRPSHYVTLAQANYNPNLFHTILCAVVYPGIRASKYNTDASFILPNTIGPSEIP